MPSETSDLIAIILAVVVGIVVIITAVAGVVVIIWGEEGATTLGILDFISKIIGVLVGALIGYMAGRKRNGNGHS